MSKEKGARLEREILEDMRSSFPGSVRCRQESVEQGDKPDVRAGPFSIECKNQKAVNYQEALDQAIRRKDPLTEWAIVVAQPDRRKAVSRRLVVMEYTAWLEMVQRYVRI